MRFILTVRFISQFVECLNISNQTIVSTALGAGQKKYATAVLKRHVAYAVASIVSISSLIFLLRGPVLGLFTSDVSVIREVMTTLPFLFLLFPADAICSMLDGSLTASGQAAWCAQNTIIISLCVIGLLTAVRSTGDVSLISVWACLKMLTLVRVPFLVHRALFSAASPFRTTPAAVPALPTVTRF